MYRKGLGRGQLWVAIRAASSARRGAEGERRQARQLALLCMIGRKRASEAVTSGRACCTQLVADTADTADTSSLYPSLCFHVALYICHTPIRAYARRRHARPALFFERAFKCQRRRRARDGQVDKLVGGRRDGVTGVPPAPRSANTASAARR